MAACTALSMLCASAPPLAVLLAAAARGLGLGGSPSEGGPRSPLSALALTRSLRPRCSLLPPLASASAARGVTTACAALPHSRADAPPLAALPAAATSGLGPRRLAKRRRLAPPSPYSRADAPPLAALLAAAALGFGLGGSRSGGGLHRLPPPTDALPAATALGLGLGGLCGDGSSRRSLFPVLARRLWLRYLLLPPSAPASAACEAMAVCAALYLLLCLRAVLGRAAWLFPPRPRGPRGCTPEPPGLWRLASDWALTALPLGSRALSAQATAMGSSGSLGGSSAAVGGTRAAAAHARRSVAHAR